MPGQILICGPHQGAPVPDLWDLGAAGCRFTYHPDRWQEQADYCTDLRANLLLPVVELDTDSLHPFDWERLRHSDPDDPWWRGAIAIKINDMAERFPDGLIHILGGMNEWDATSGDESSVVPVWFENQLMQMVRAAFGPAQLLAHGAIITGQPDRLKELEWRGINYANVHDYTKVAPGFSGPPGGSMMDLAQYRNALGSVGAWWVRLMISEIGGSSWQMTEQQQAEYLESILPYASSLMDNEELVAWFSYHDHRGFGIVREDGSHKPAYAAFQRVTGAQGEPMDPYLPWRGVVGGGILDAMEQDGTLPAQAQPTWLPLDRQGAATVEQVRGQNGIVYEWQLPFDDLLGNHYGGSGLFRYRPS